jgi:phosphoribosylformylglycinamidine synthase
VIDLDKCPTAEPNLAPAVIAVGETQERLAWVVPPHFTSRLLDIYNDEYGLPEIAKGAQAAVIGHVAASKDYVLRWHGEEVMRVPIDFLTGGMRYEREGVTIGTLLSQPSERGDSHSVGRHGELLAAALAHRDVCSRRAIYERYDSVVRGATAIPAGAADAGVIVPIPGAPLGVALSVAGNPRYGALDPSLAADYAVCEAVRNVVAVGARPVGLTDCLNFGNPEDPEQMGEFVDAVNGLTHAAELLALPRVTSVAERPRSAGKALNLPFVSGNVSLYNQSSNGQAIPASPIVACVGTFADVSIAATLAFKRVGSAVYVLGYPRSGLKASIISEILGTSKKESMPRIDYEQLRHEVAALREAFDRRLVLAAHDVSDGGLLVALAEMCFAARPALVGVNLDFAQTECLCQAFDSHGRGEFGHLDALFGEAGGFVVETSDDQTFSDVLQAHDCIANRVGSTVASDIMTLFSGSRVEERLHLGQLYEAWSSPLNDFYGDAA